MPDTSTAQWYCAKCGVVQTMLVVCTNLVPPICPKDFIAMRPFVSATADADLPDVPPPEGQ